MVRRTAAVLTTTVLVAAAALAAPTGSAGAAPPRASSDQAGPTVYVGALDAAQLGQLRAAGLDREDIAARKGVATARGRVGVEVVMGRGQATKLIAQGLPLTEKKIDGRSVSSRLRAEAAPSVFRPYSERGRPGRGAPRSPPTTPA